MLFGYVRSCDIRILYLCESALLVVIWPRYMCLTNSQTLANTVQLEHKVKPLQISVILFFVSKGIYLG